MNRMFRYASDQSLFLDLAPDATDLPALFPIPGVVNIHPAYASILLVFDPLRTSHDEVQRAAAAIQPPQSKAPRPLHQIHIHYDGPDLDSLARLHNLSPHRVVELHAAANYTVAFLGFVPGFAYLHGLPAALATPLPPQSCSRRQPRHRRRSNRHLPHRHSRRLATHRPHNHRTLQPPQHTHEPPPTRRSRQIHPRMKIVIDNPSMFTTVQDLGRPGHGIDGVSRSGAADPLALRIANRILGNNENTPPSQ